MMNLDESRMKNKDLQLFVEYGPFLKKSFFIHLSLYCCGDRRLLGSMACSLTIR